MTQAHLGACVGQLLLHSGQLTAASGEVVGMGAQLGGLRRAIGRHEGVWFDLVFYTGARTGCRSPLTTPGSAAGRPAESQ